MGVWTSIKPTASTRTDLVVHILKPGSVRERERESKLYFMPFNGN